MTFDFSAAVTEQIQSREQEIHNQAVHDVLTALFSDPNRPLRDLATALGQAHDQGLLNGLTLGQVLSGNGTAPGSTQRLSATARQQAQQTIIDLLEKSKTPLSKAALMSRTENRVVHEHWPSLIRSLKRQGIVQSQGEARHKKTYCLNTDKTPRGK